MYERLLNKQEQPTFEQMVRYSGDSGPLWLALDAMLKDTHNADTLIRFPYGNEYGWGVKYSVKKRHICDVFAENGSFTALFQVSNRAVETVHDTLADYAKQIWADKHPCATGGWIEFRVLDKGQLADLEKILHAKITVRK